MSIRISKIVNDYAKQATALLKAKAKVKRIKANNPEFRDLLKEEKRLAKLKAKLLESGLSEENPLASATFAITLSEVTVEEHKRRTVTVL